MFPVPDEGSPIAGLLLVQFIIVPATLDEKLTALALRNSQLL